MNSRKPRPKELKKREATRDIAAEISADLREARGAIKPHNQVYFYNYFDSKEQLFGEVIAEAARRRAVSHYANAEDRGTTRERLLALAAADVDVLRKQEAFMKVVVREAMAFRPETYPLIVEHLTPFLQKIEAVLSAGVVAGEVRGDKPTLQLALIFVGMLALLYVQHWGSGGAWPLLDDVPQLAVSAFLDGAAIKKSGRFG